MLNFDDREQAQTLDADYEFALEREQEILNQVGYIEDVDFDFDVTFDDGLPADAWTPEE